MMRSYVSHCRAISVPLAFALTIPLGQSALCDVTDPVFAPTISEVDSNTGPAQYEWSLDEVLKIAENQNPDLKSAKFNFNAESKTVLQATSEYLPHLSIEAGVEKTTLPNPSAGLTDQIGVALPYTDVVAKVHQTLFDFGKGANDIGAARAHAKSAQFEMESVHDVIELAARSTFYKVLQSEKLVDVANQGVATFQETYRRAASMVKAGTRPNFDLTQASVQLSQAKLKLVEAINARDLARVVLLNLLGMQNEVRFRLKESPTSQVQDIQKLNLENLIARAIANRPEIQRSQASLEAVRMQTHSVSKDYFPVLSLEGWYGKYYANYPSTLADAYGGGLALSWSLFDGLKTTGRLGELAARFEQEYAKLEKQRETIVADVAKSFADLRSATDYLSLVEKNLDAAKENARIAKRRYDSNVSTFLELLVAQTSLLDAQAIFVQSKYQYEIALANIRHAVKSPIP